MSTTATSKVPRLNRKVAVMGYPYVGKSALVLRFIQGYFPEKYESTIEDQHTKQLPLLSRDYHLRVTDTAGQQEYTVFPRSCSLDIHGFILVYAVDDRRSFQMITHIYDKIVQTYGDHSLPIVIVGNKADLDIKQHVVRPEEGEALATKWGAQFMEITAKEGAKVNELFETVLREIEISRGNLSRPSNDKGGSCTII